MNLNKFIPPVSRKVLMLLSGIIWLYVGLMLIHYAYSWLVVEQRSTVITFAGAGIVLTMGITLRHSSIQKPWLAILYIGIGLGLFLSSVRYIRYF